MITVIHNRRESFTSGFTLVETLVAVTILLMVIVGPMSIAAQGLKNAYYAGEQTTAIYLAQEAVEYIQKLRDDNALDAYLNTTNDTSRWYNTTIPAACKDTNKLCDINLDSGAFRDCSAAANNCKLGYYPNPTGVRSYGYNSAEPGYAASPYTRTIKIDAPVGGTGASAGESIGGVPVTVTVTWYAGLFRGNRSVVLQTYVYDSYMRYEI